MQIPTEWKAVLEVIQRYKPDATLVGGALRDLDNGKPVKDLDIFVQVTGMEDFTALCGQLLEEGGLKLSDPLDVSEYGNWTPDVVGLVDIDASCFFHNSTVNECGYAPPLAPTVQLIGIKTPTDEAHLRVDLSMCQIAWDGARILRTKEYERDKAHMTFTITRADDDAQTRRTMRRWTRISQKYNGWELRKSPC